MSVTTEVIKEWVPFRELVRLLGKLGYPDPQLRAEQCVNHADTQSMEHDGVTLYLVSSQTRTIYHTTENHYFAGGNF